MALIDREALKNRLKYGWVNAKFVLRIIDEMPEADPERHGRWIKDESTYAGPGLDNLQCSECKRNAVTWRRDIPLSRMYRYCPNCGAKMDGGEDETGLAE